MQSGELAVVHTALLSKPNLVLDFLAFALSPDAGLYHNMLEVRTGKPRIVPSQDEGLELDERLTQGEAFLKSLHENGQLFHLEDDPAEIIDGDGNPLFTAQQVQSLNCRIDELYAMEWGKLVCPIGYIVQILWSKNEKEARS